MDYVFTFGLFTFLSFAAFQVVTVLATRKALAFVRRR